MNNKKKVYILFISILVITSFIATFLIVQINSDKIMKNVYVNDINIGNISKNEAKKILEEKYKLKDIVISSGDSTWNIHPSEINLSYNIEKTIDKAYRLNKGNSLLTNIKETTNSIFGKKKIIDIEVSYDKDKIDILIKKIADEVNVYPKDASININGGSISIVDEIVGKKVDEEATINSMIENISNKIFECKLVVAKEKAKITKGDLSNIDTLLGSHSTKFDSGVSGRTQNIKLSAQRTSDVLLMPGETFSYNKHTGKRTLSNGYKNAPVIVQGVVQEGIGGGVCQVSTTLYNATLYAGLEYVELRNHSIPSSYAPKGRDATVADGSIDFVFKNNLNYPIYIKNSVYGNIVTCQIYGSFKDKQKIEISTNVDAVSIAPIKKIDDPTIDKGNEKVLERGRDGYTVSTYRIYKDKSGKEIGREKVSKSYYPKKQGIIAVGTKEIVKEEPPIEQPPQPETQPPIESIQPEQPSQPEIPSQIENQTPITEQPLQPEA